MLFYWRKLMLFHKILYDFMKINVNITLNDLCQKKNQITLFLPVFGKKLKKWSPILFLFFFISSQIALGKLILFHIICFLNV